MLILGYVRSSKYYNPFDPTDFFQDCQTLVQDTETRHEAKLLNDVENEKPQKNVYIFM